jgi:uncharacterized protein
VFYKQLFATLFFTSLLSPTSLSARTKSGDEYLAEGQRAEQAQNYETALQLYDYAVEEDPRDPAYLTADRRARSSAVETRRSQARKLIEAHNLIAAKGELQAAMTLDPGSKEAQEDVHNLEQLIRNSPEPPALEPPNDPIYRITIVKNAPRAAYEAIARAAGIAVNFDSDVADASVGQEKAAEVSGISVEDALNFTASVTQTSWKPVSRTEVRVTRTGAQNSPPASPFAIRGANQPRLVSKQTTSFSPSALAPGEALPAAAQADRLADVVHLVLRGANINTPNSLGMSTLLLGAIGDDPEIVRFLLDHGANANLTGQTILHAAVSHGNEQIVRLLLESHADPNALDEHSNSPLDRAVFGGHPEIARLLLTKGSNANEGHWPDGRNLLHEICARGPAAMIPLLVDFGADAASQDRFGESPVDLALANGNEAAVAVLLKLAQQNKPVQNTAASAMEDAVVRGRTSSARVLLDAGFNINQLTSQGSTYLGDAALKRQLSVVTVLLDKGASVSLRARSGATALHDAALGGNPAVIDLLLDRGADINAREIETGATPLMLAASLNQLDAVAELLKHGANLELRDRDGQSALDHARDAESVDIVALLKKSKL